MAKTKSKPKPTKSNKSKRSRRSRPVSRPGMDAAALAYARLLSDPCGAPLVHPVYAGAGSGYLARFQSTFEISNKAVEGMNGSHVSNLAVCFTPGQISNAPSGWASNGSGLGSVQYLTQFWNGTSWIRKLSNDHLSQPGFSFLNGMANNKNVSCRPVAACMKVRYTGTEFHRSGLCGASFLPNAETFINEDLGASGTVTDAFASRVVNTAQKTTRTPDGDIEIKWCPNRGDVRFRDITNSGPTNVSGQPDHAGVCFGVVGLPTDTDVSFTITLTCVYEWTPDMDTGVQVPFQTTRSSSTLDAVLSYLQSAGNWMVSSHPAANMLRNAAYTGMRNAMFGTGFAGGYNSPRIEL